jgi:ubiquinone/menaquinone biosynthesis C-methylase UbiE
MFGKNGPTLLELVHQALCSTERGYDLLAPKFDSTPFRTPDEILIPAVAAIGEVDAALDLCCGTGAAMRFLRPVCRERLTGVDFSHGMLQQARARLAEAPGPVEPELVNADVFNLDFQEEFDVVTCFGAHGHILPRDEPAFLRIVYRALKPGGRFVFVTGYPPPMHSISGLVLRAFNTIMRIRNALIKPPFIMYYLTFLLPQVAELLAGEGFAVEIRSNVFEPPLERYRLVIATRLQEPPTSRGEQERDLRPQAGG